MSTGAGRAWSSHARTAAARQGAAAGRQETSTSACAPVGESASRASASRRSSRAAASSAASARAPSARSRSRGARPSWSRPSASRRSTCAPSLSHSRACCSTSSGSPSSPAHHAGGVDSGVPSPDGQEAAPLEGESLMPRRAPHAFQEDRDVASRQASGPQRIRDAPIARHTRPAHTPGTHARHARPARTPRRAPPRTECLPSPGYRRAGPGSDVRFLPPAANQPAAAQPLVRALIVRLSAPCARPA